MIPRPQLLALASVLLLGDRGAPGAAAFERRRGRGNPPGQLGPLGREGRAS